MKKTTILLTLVGINALSASTESTERDRTIDILIKEDVVVERAVPQSRVLRINREARANRVVHMGRNSRGVRPQRVARVVYETEDNRKSTITATALIKKSYLSKLSK